MAYSTHTPQSRNRLVELEHLRWQLQDREREEALRQDSKEGPWVAVSAQLGAFGREIADRISKTLDWPVYDKEILTSIAHHAGSPDRVLVHDDERKATGMYDYLAHLLVPGHLSRASYEVELMRVVAEVGRRGHAVLYGRGAQFVLDPAHGLRVRIVGEREARVAAYALEAGIPIDESARRIDEDDAARRDFVLQVFHREVDDPFGYDLVLNGPALGLETCSRILLEAYRAKLEKG